MINRIILLRFYFWMMPWVKNVSNFQEAKVKPEGVTNHLLDFLPISAWRCL